MRKIFYLLSVMVVFCLTTVPAYSVEVYIIDNFDDMNFKYDKSVGQAWYAFGDSKLGIGKVNSTVSNKYSAAAGVNYLDVQGDASEWYVGGIGRKINQDTTKFSHVKLLVYGRGEKSGKLLLEVYDDDNNNDELEMDSGFNALHDDKWAFELEVTWEGWRVITVPFADFEDANPNVGDDIFNPEAGSGSVGMLSFQMIFLANDKVGSVKYGVDEIKLVQLNGGSKLLVDNFEDGNLESDYKKQESWWTFGNLNYDIVTDQSHDRLGKYTGKGILKLSGKTKEWYVGGFGKYLAIDGSVYNKVKLMVYGNGKDSGTINLEIYDDDNNNDQMEQDDNFNPIHDDKWTTSFNVNWTGWKVVSIPFYKFKDSNKRIGDNKFNLDKSNGSGGLLHFQVIINAAKKIGAVDIAIDNIKLVE